MERKPTSARSHGIDDIDIDVDGLVASYTALGKAQRRGSWLRRTMRLGLAAAAAAGAAAAVVYRVPSVLLDAVAPSSDGVRQLRALVSSELEQLGTLRAELTAERDRYNKSSAALEIGRAHV